MRVPLSGTGALALPYLLIAITAERAVARGDEETIGSVLRVAIPAAAFALTFAKDDL